MRPVPRWSEFKSRARELTARGRSEWNRARLRLASGWRARSEPPPPEDVEILPDGTAAARSGLSRKVMIWTGAVLGLLILVIIVVIALWDWDRFRGPIADYATGRLHREVRIDGHLKVHLLTWTPEATVTGLRIGNPDWAPKGDFGRIDSVHVKVRLMPLLTGRVDMPLVEIQRPDLKMVKDAQGRANWDFDPKGKHKPTRLPPIQHLIVRDGHIDMTDVRRRLHLVATVQTNEDEPGSGRGRFLLSGDGTINSHAFVLRISGGPLIDVRRDQPYHFDADMRAGPTHISATGVIDKPFDFGRYHARLSGTGDDLADLYEITGLTFPNTPPYHASGDFSRDGSVYRYSHFAGRVGRSDLAGEVTVSKPKDRPLLQADLVSRSLDWADLATVLGGAPAARKGGPASPAQKIEAHVMAVQGRLLPDARLDVSRLRAMDADVGFRATAVQANRMRLSAVRMRVKLDHGLLTVDPLTFGFARGVLAGSVKIDGRQAMPHTDLDLKLSNYALESFIPAIGGAPPMSGMVDGHFRLKGSGMSVRETAAGAGGTVSLTVPHGEVRQALAELLGINVGRGLSLLLSKDQHKTELRCAAADFDVSGGTMRVRRMVIDTGVVVSQGSGTVDLGSERLNLRLQGKSKKPRLLRLWGPITVTGTLLNPKPGVDKSSVVEQGGVAALAATAINPLAAILPFLTPGGAKDVDCASLLAGGSGAAH